MVIFLMKKKGRYSGGKKGGKKKKVEYDFYKDKKMGPVISQPVHKKKKGRKCHACGTISPINDRFCTVCGKSFSDDSPVSKGPGVKVKWADNDESGPARGAQSRSGHPAGGRNRERGPKAVDWGSRCAVCNADLFGNQRFCTVCGLSREGKMQKKPCWVCGAAISVNDGICIICGSSQQTTIPKKGCLVCGAAISVNDGICIVCGAAQQKTVTIKSCQVCGTALSANERFCPVCSSSRERTVQKSCFVCGAALSVNERFCIVCGAESVQWDSGENAKAKRDGKIIERYYEILDIEPGASRDEIKKAFKRKIIEYHPDKVHSLGKKLREIAEEETKKITEAYQALMKI